MGTTQNTPAETAGKSVETKMSVDSLRPHLTPEQFHEVQEARRKALQADIAKRLEVLQGSLSADIQQKLNENAPSWKEIVEEKGMPSSAVDSVKDVITNGFHTAKNTAETAFRSTPFVGGVFVALDSIQEGGRRLSDAWENPKQFFSEFWDALKSIFTDLSFDKIKAFFSPSHTLAGLRKGLEKIGNEFEFGLLKSADIKESWRELFVDTKEFRAITIEELRKHQNSSDMVNALKLPSSVSSHDLKNFMEPFFQEKNFTKFSEVLRGKGKTVEDIEKMTISDAVQQYAAQ